MVLIITVAGVVELLIEVGGFRDNTGLEWLVQYLMAAVWFGGHFEHYYFSISGRVIVAVVFWLSLICTAGRCDTDGRLHYRYKWRMANLLRHICC